MRGRGGSKSKKTEKKVVADKYPPLYSNKDNDNEKIANRRTKCFEYPQLDKLPSCFSMSLILIILAMSYDFTI